MKAILNGVLLSFSYFSVLPIPLKTVTLSKKTYSSLLVALPLVGFVIAFLSVLLFIFLKDFMPLTYCAILSACFYLYLYGFLHLEALCDVIDGYFASLSNKDVYAIMKEPHVGAVGAIGTFVFVLLKIVVISYLLIESKEELFLASVIFSRLGLIFGLFAFKFHKKSSFALGLKSAITIKLIVLTFLFYMLFSYFLLDVKIVLLFSLVAVLMTTVILYKLKKIFGFLNGDCLGTSLEKTEFILLNIGLLL